MSFTNSVLSVCFQKRAPTASASSATPNWAPNSNPDLSPPAKPPNTASKKTKSHPTVASATHAVASVFVPVTPIVHCPRVPIHVAVSNGSARSHNVSKTYHPMSGSHYLPNSTCPAVSPSVVRRVSIGFNDVWVRSRNGPRRR